MASDFDIRPGGRLIMINGTFGALLRTLFPTTGDDLGGAPDWLDTERYDVNVKVEGNPTLDLGPRMRRSTVDCAVAASTDRVTEPHPCGLLIDGGRMTSEGVLIGDLVRNLSAVAGRVVIDQTGLKERYELTLRGASAARCHAYPGAKRDPHALPQFPGERLGRLAPRALLGAEVLGACDTGPEGGWRFMWPGFGPEMRRDLDAIRQMARLRHQTPTREWPLLVEGRDDDLLVVREWPDGSMTAYLMDRPSR